MNSQFAFGYWLGRAGIGMHTVADVFFDEVEAERRKQVLARWRANRERWRMLHATAEVATHRPPGRL